eukprot:11169360-Alexandrium_andersonii.AAC.1
MPNLGAFLALTCARLMSYWHTPTSRSIWPGKCPWSAYTAAAAESVLAYLRKHMPCFLPFSPRQ